LLGLVVPVFLLSVFEVIADEVFDVPLALETVGVIYQIELELESVELGVLDDGVDDRLVAAGVFRLAANQNLDNTEIVPDVVVSTGRENELLDELLGVGAIDWEENIGNGQHSYLLVHALSLGFLWTVINDKAVEARVRHYKVQAAHKADDLVHADGEARLILQIELKVVDDSQVDGHFESRGAVFHTKYLADFSKNRGAELRFVPLLFRLQKHPYRNRAPLGTAAELRRASCHNSRPPSAA
jgi:hypothetical protein